MQLQVSKSQFKAKALEYLREVEKKNQTLTITHAGKPVVDIIPHKEKSDSEEILKSLRGSIKFYNDPDEPVGLEDWEALK